MYEVSVNFKNIYTSSVWPDQWLLSRALKAIVKADVESKYVKNAKDVLNAKQIFVCKNKPKILFLWGGDKLINIRKI